MSSCLTPTTTIKTYPATSVDDNLPCEFLKDWEECGTGCDRSGYNLDDAVAVCINGVKYIARSLKDDNTDSPQAGAVAVPATWEIKTLAQWLFN